MNTSRSSSTPSSSASEGSARLSRGSACLNCRRRRVRCDGQRPICGPCSRFRGHELDDCEFYEGQIPTTQVLQEKIADLEDRLAELQGNDDPTQLRLHQPYAPSATAGLQTDYGGSFSANDIKVGALSRMQEFILKQIQTLPPTKIQSLMNNFRLLSTDVAFFLDMDRFLKSAMQVHNIGHHTRPAPSVLYAVCLWALRPLPKAARRLYEESFLTSALRFVTEDLSSSHPHKFIHVLQAEVLLSLYFLTNNRTIEGTYHANAAASLAISTKSNLIRSITTLQKTNYGDSVEEGEWIDGFWTTVILSNYWVLVNENQTFTFYDAPQMPVDTPWPLNDYRQEQITPTSYRPLQSFLDGSSEEGLSLLAFHAKASILLKRVIENNRNAVQEACQSFKFLDRSIERFGSLVPKASEHMDRQQQQRLAIIHLLTHTVVIKLHRFNAQASKLSRQRCVHAACAIADIASKCVPNKTIYFVNPIIGIALSIALDVLKLEVQYLRRHGMVTDNMLSHSANRILQCINSISEDHPFIASLFQDTKIKPRDN